MSTLKQERKLICRIIEAKNLSVDKGKTCDAYAVVNLDRREERTPTIFNNTNPFWSEEFTFEEIESNFRQLSVLVKNKATDDPFGQVLFPKALLTSGQLEEEQWFVLAPVDIENSVNGDVRLKIAYFPPKNDIRTHTFAVNVVAGRNLIARTPEGTSHPYVVLHLLPDLRVKSTQVTKPHKENLSPNFNETFILYICVFDCVLSNHSVVDELRADIELHISVWHCVKDGQPSNDDIFMGHSSIPLGDTKTGLKTDRWYTLLPKPGHIENLGILLEKRKKNRKNSEGMTKPKMFALALQTSDLDAAVASKSFKSPHKFVDVKLTSLSYCGHCSGIMWAQSSHKNCKICRVNCHVKCAKFIANNCNAVGMVRVKIKYSVFADKMCAIIIGNSDSSTSKIMSENEYEIPTILGRIIQEREEVAKCLVRILDSRGQVEGFIKNLITNELAVASDPNTLFRANSMASKAVDVYMKHVGMSYLKKALGPIISIIVLSDKNCEVDPSRLEKKDDINQNWKSLIGYFEGTLQAIFSSTQLMPNSLRIIFCHLRENVIKKFPNDQHAKYTAVSGFIFLRFFAAAILGPKLFKLMDEYADNRAARTFTLLAKCVQNLANLVEFGQKEPFMVNINTAINSNIQNMKSFIDEISKPLNTSSNARISNPIHPVENVGKECARILDILLKSSEKILEGTREPEKPTVAKLMGALGELSKSLEEANLYTGPSNRVSIKASNDSEDALPSGVFKQQQSTTELLSPVASEPPKPTYDQPKDNQVSEVKPGVEANVAEKRKVAYSATLVERPKVEPVKPRPKAEELFNPQMNRIKSESLGVKPQRSSSSDTLVGSDSPQPTRVLPSSGDVNKNSNLAPVQYAEAEQLNESKEREPVRRIAMQGQTLKPVRSQHAQSMVLTNNNTNFAMPNVKSKKVDVNTDDSELDSMLQTLNSLSADIDSPQGSGKNTPSNIPGFPAVSPIISGSQTLRVSPTREKASRQQLALSQLLDAQNSLSAVFDGPERPLSSYSTLSPSIASSENQPAPPDNPQASPPLRSPSSSLSSPIVPQWKMCAKCDEPIFDAMIEAVGKSWHKTCFTCTDCGVLLVSNYVPYDNMPYCKQDYLKRSGLICGVCGEYIETAYIDVLGRKYHTTCKKCDSCGQLLAGRHYFALNGQTFCSEHREMYMNCRFCKLPIEGQVLVALRNQYQYHPEHFNCSSCRVNLSNTHFFERDDSPFCQQCYYRTSVRMLTDVKVGYAQPTRLGTK